MIKGKDTEKTYYFRDPEVLKIIETAESKNDEELTEMASNIRNDLVGNYGFLQYKK